MSDVTNSKVFGTFSVKRSSEMPQEPQELITVDANYNEVAPDSPDAAFRVTPQEADERRAAMAEAEAPAEDAEAEGEGAVIEAEPEAPETEPETEPKAKLSAANKAKAAGANK